MNYEINRALTRHAHLWNETEKKGKITYFSSILRLPRGESLEFQIGGTRVLVTKTETKQLVIKVPGTLPVTFLTVKQTVNYLQTLESIAERAKG